MIRNLVLVVTLNLLLFLNFSCQNSGNLKVDQALEAVPANASVITAFDLPTLMEKANLEAIKKMEAYQFFLEQAQLESDVLATVMANPENAGIDLTKPAYLSIELDENNPEVFYTGLIFNLASAEDFKHFAQSFNDVFMGKRAGYETADLSDKFQLAWNEQIAVIAYGEEIYEQEAVVNTFFNPDAGNSLANNENLTQLLAQNHDITTWVSSNPLAQNNNAKLVLSLAKIAPEALNDNYVHGFVDFNEGQVDAQLNYFFQDALVEDVRLLFKEEVKTDFSPFITSQNLNSYLALALDFKGLNVALSKRPQVKMFADFALKSYGLSIQKLKEALDGDMVIATYTGNINNRQEGLVVLKLNNQAQFEALLAVAEEKELVTKTAKGRYTFAPSLHHFLTENLPVNIGSSFDNQLLLHNGLAFISGNIDRLDAIEQGNIQQTSITPDTIKKLLQQNPLALFMDFNSLKRIGLPGAADLNRLQFQSNGQGATFQLTLKNTQINSLQGIFEAMNQYFLQDKERRQPVSQEKS